MEQLDILTNALTEESIFNILKPALMEVVERNHANPDKLIFKSGNDYSSVWYDSQMAFRIYCRGKKQYFSVSDSKFALAPEHIRNTSFKTEPGFHLLRYVQTPEGIKYFSEYFSALVDSAIDSISKGFDCCSRFEECSNAMHCVHPNPDIAVTCGYRKILKSGRCFYGPNRNVD